MKIFLFLFKIIKKEFFVKVRYIFIELQNNWNFDRKVIVKQFFKKEYYFVLFKFYKVGKCFMGYGFLNIGIM